MSSKRPSYEAQVERFARDLCAFVKEVSGIDTTPQQQALIVYLSRKAPQNRRFL